MKYLWMAGTTTWITILFMVSQIVPAFANSVTEERLIKDNKEDDNLNITSNFSALKTDLALLESEEVVYTASKKLETIRTAPNAISVISSSHIRSLGALYIPPILRLFPGIDVVQLSRFEYTIGLRGFINRSTFRTRDVLILVDGRTIYDDFSGNIEWESIDIFPQDIAKIEVIRGASSAIHGANGSRGIVNIFTRPPPAISSIESDTTVLNNGFHQRIASGYLNGSYSFKISGGFEDIEIWDRFENEIINGEDNAKTWRFNAALQKRMAHGADLTLSGGSNTGTLLQHTTSGFLVENHQSTNHVQLNYESQDISSRFFWNNRDLESIGPTSGRTLTTRHQNMYDIEVIKRYIDFGTNDLSIGGHLRLTDINSRSTAGKKTQTTWGLFVDDKYSWSNALLIHVAGRIDHHDQAGYNFSPRFGVSYNLDLHHTIKASVNVGVRNPTFSNNFFDISFGPTKLVGNKDLKPEKSIWYETGYTGKPNDKLTVGIDLFHVVMSDIITPIESPFIVSFVNNPEEIKGYGSEIWAQYTLSPTVRILGNYAYSYYEQNSKKLEGTVPHKINLGLLLDQWKKFTGALTFHYVDSTTVPFFIGGTPGANSTKNAYETVNLILGYQFTNTIRLRLDIQNLTNNKHRELPPIGEELSTDIRLTLTYNR